MSNTSGFGHVLEADMKEKGIDIKLTQKILSKFNAGQYDHIEPVKVTNIPVLDGKTIIDLTGDLQVRIDLKRAQQNIDKLGLAVDLTKIGQVVDGEIIFDKSALKKLGQLLYPVLAYGILNGGSASSYVDIKKNKAFNETLFEICKKEFALLEKLSKGRAKGLTPAFINKNGTLGPSFIELKMRALLIEILRYQSNVGGKFKTILPMFQMTSVYNNEEVGRAYREYKNSPILKDLIEETGIDITEVQTGVQPMLAAFSPSSAGRPKTLFTNAYGKENNTLPMPGGHGQNFEILADVYRDLWQKGIKYIYLGNVDNIGYTVDPVSLALVALENKQAGFEFAFRTVVDVKGGILVVDQRNRLNCADIGPAISKDEVLKAEKEGKKILFNCAIGLFNLEYLVANLERIIENLPVRFSDQDKDAGLYSQAEQVTWEIIGMLDDFLIFGVNKYERFLAAKMLLEGLMTSGVGLDDPRYPTNADPEKDFRSIAEKLHTGLRDRLENVYGMKFKEDHWTPKTVEELKREILN